MYKIGDKVETKDNYYKKLNGVVVKDNYPKEYNQVRVKYSLEFEETIENDFLIKQPSAHEKLIELGYELTKRTDYVFYRHDDLPRVTIYSDKTYSCSDTNLALSRILMQYLEELEAKE